MMGDTQERHLKPTRSEANDSVLLLNAVTFYRPRLKWSSVYFEK